MWATVLTALVGLEAGVLLILRRQTFSRVWLTPVDLRSWRLPPTGSPQPSDLRPDAVSLMREVGDRLRFHGDGPPELDHPAFHLAPGSIEGLMTGETSPAVGCGTYANVLNHVLSEKGIESRVVVAHSPHFREGHVVVEAWLGEVEGWIVLDPLYGALFEAPDGSLLDAPGIRQTFLRGETVRIRRASEGDGDPGLTAGKLLGHLSTGLFEHLVAFRAARLRRPRPPLVARGWVLADGVSQWWLRTRALQLAAVVWAMMILVVLAAWTMT